MAPLVLRQTVIISAVLKPIMPIPNLIRESVEAILRRRYGTPIELTELQGGDESRVYVLAGDRSKRILRVGRSRFGFDKDAFAYRHFHSSSLPIPVVLEIGDLDGTNYFCITSYASGKTLQDLSGDQMQPVLQPVADVLQSIRESDISATHGFGLLDQHGTGSHPSWSSFLQWPDTQQWSNVPHLVDTSQLRSMIGKLPSLSEDAGDFRCLLHGDFGSNNVLTNGQSITAVIDWSEAMIGDPLYDVANIFFWRTWLTCMEYQARFFEERLSSDEDTQNRLLCYQLHIGLRQLRESAITADWDAVAWAMARLKSLPV
jgi:hygromycin-B 4-O-kinase